MSGPEQHKKRTAELQVVEKLAQFRYQIRRFLRFSETAVRKAGITPQQHQLMLGVAGFTGRGWANVSELAEFLQERHNAVVELVNRAARAGLVRREISSRDRRVVRVELTSRGRSISMKLSALHREELERIRDRRNEEMLPQIAKRVRVS
ncbi:MAG: MarR family transcriptional regulator [Candidatus Acidiferrales bacterium]